MPEIVAVPAPQVVDVWVVENSQLEYLGLEPQPPVEIIVVRQVEVVALVDTGKGDQGEPGPVGPAGQSVIPYTSEDLIPVAVGTQPYRFLFDAVILGWAADVSVAPQGSPVIVDMNVNGSTVFPDPDDRLHLAANTVQTPELPLNIPVVSGDRLTIDVDDIGSTFAGEDLTVVIRYERA